MSRIYQYPVVTEIGSDDYLALGSATNGSRAILASDLAPVIGNKTITERGTYKASDDNMDGYGQVTVDIPYTDIHVASGDIATFEGEDLPLKSLKVAVTPYQDLSHGDPSPSNICPISGWDEAVVTRCGKNLCNIADGNITTTKQIGVATLKAGTYTFSLEAYRQDGGCASFSVMNGQTVIAQTEEVTGATTYKPLSVTFTLTEKTTVILYCSFFVSYSTLYYKNVMIEKGTIATTYSPYNGATYTIDLNGTRYGGTLDVTNGTMTVTNMEFDMGKVNYTKNNSFPNVFDYTLQNIYMTKNTSNAISEIYELYASNDVADHDYGFAISNGRYIMFFKNKDYTDPSDFKSAMSGKKVVYELDTPITVQLAPTPVKSLEGTNNIFADCGAVDVEYQTVWVRPTN